LIEETHKYQQWLKPVTKQANLFAGQQEHRSRLISRLNEVCDLIEVVLETTYYRLFKKAYRLEFIRSHFQE